MSHILTLNAGSSSLKFGLFRDGQPPVAEATGLIGAIGGTARLRLKDQSGAVLRQEPLSASDGATHASALRAGLRCLQAHVPIDDLRAVGHRVVHGGTEYAQPVRIDAETLADLERIAPFAPLHQPHNLAGVRAACEAFPDALQVACFDTAFHRGHSFVTDAFALPRRYYDAGVRRYGFHGLSYAFIAQELERIAPELHAGRVIVAHLGNGASMCALQGGRSIASTMGFSALDGLPMGTRSGQIDPGVLLYLMEQEGMSAAEISDLLYRKSGLLGLSGVSNDMRQLQASDDPRAKEAIAYYVHRIQTSVGSLTAALQGLDGLVFTAGIGENAHPIRAAVCDGLAWLGVELDASANRTNATVISTDQSRVRVMVIPTNEELMIAKGTSALLS